MWLCDWETSPPCFATRLACRSADGARPQGTGVCCAWSVGSRLPNLGVLEKAECLTLDFTQPRMSALPLQRMKWIHIVWATTGVVSRLECNCCVANASEMFRWDINVGVRSALSRLLRHKGSEVRLILTRIPHTMTAHIRATECPGECGCPKPTEADYTRGSAGFIVDNVADIDINCAIDSSRPSLLEMAVQTRQKNGLKRLSVYLRNKKMREFLDLQQNHLSLEEYVTEYRHLEAYCPHLYTTAEARADKFVYGFRDGLRGRVMSSSPHNLDEAVTMARRME
ncbi:hypothetical protein EJ110_NYTH17294 [Nymphaea thermarum]|nr:hypothetical protein EJ110_NYTH17294 [Nymphaea thermarum]